MIRLEKVKHIGCRQLQILINEDKKCMKNNHYLTCKHISTLIWTYSKKIGSRKKKIKKGHWFFSKAIKLI